MTEETAIAKQAPAAIAWIQADDTHDKLAEIAANGFDVARFTRSVLTSANRNPKLAQCSPQSFAACAMECAQLGLMPGAAGHVYLIPRDKREKKGGQWVTNGSECTIIVGYRGLLHAIRKALPGIFIDAHHVYEHDECDLVVGEKPRHVLNLKERGESLGVYATAKEPGSDEWHTVWMPRDELNEHKIAHAPTKYGTSTITGPWASHAPEMERKTALRRLAKILPTVQEVDALLAAEGDFSAPADDAPSGETVVDVRTYELNDEYGGNDDGVDNG